MQESPVHALYLFDTNAHGEVGHLSTPQNMHVCVYVRECFLTCSHAYTCSRRGYYVYTFIHSYIHTYIVHMYIHAYICTCRAFWMRSGGFNLPSFLPLFLSSLRRYPSYPTDYRDARFLAAHGTRCGVGVTSPTRARLRATAKNSPA